MTKTSRHAAGNGGVGAGTRLGTRAFAAGGGVGSGGNRRVRMAGAAAILVTSAAAGCTAEAVDHSSTAGAVSSPPTVTEIFEHGAAACNARIAKTEGLFVYDTASTRAEPPRLVAIYPLNPFGDTVSRPHGQGRGYAMHTYFEAASRSGRVGREYFRCVASYTPAGGWAVMDHKPDSRSSGFHAPGFTDTTRFDVGGLPRSNSSGGVYVGGGNRSPQSGGGIGPGT